MCPLHACAGLVDENKAGDTMGRFLTAVDDGSLLVALLEQGMHQATSVSAGKIKVRIGAQSCAAVTASV